MLVIGLLFVGALAHPYPAFAAGKANAYPPITATEADFQSLEIKAPEAVQEATPPEPTLVSVEMLDVNQLADEPPVEPAAPSAPAFHVAPRHLLASQLPEKKGTLKKVGKKKLKTTPKKPRKTRVHKAPIEDEFKEEDYDREPADDSGIRTFKASIRGLIEFNGEWEVSFHAQPRRYRLREGLADEVSEYQSSGQFVEVRVHEPSRKVLSINPVKVRFRPIR